MLQRQNLDEAGRHAAAVVSRQADHLTQLVDDLLDVSRITQGKIELRREFVTLASVLAVAIEAASPAIVREGHRLTLAITDGDAIELYADPTRLTQVITNLLDNSARYTPRGGEITLEARRVDGYAIVCVRDNGIGIPAEALCTVFEMFRQVDRPDRPQGGGLGVGLALVKRLVEMHDGVVEARSAGVGQGTEFLIRVPVAQRGAVDGGERIGPLPTQRHALKVLAVDDNEDFVEMLAVLVRDAGHDVRTALDGGAALSIALSYHPDVVLLDLGLPVLSGIDVARKLRQHPETATAHVVALTGWGTDDDRRQTSEAGFDLHLTKPTDPSTLERLLAEIAVEGRGHV